MGQYDGIVEEYNEDSSRVTSAVFTDKMLREFYHFIIVILICIIHVYFHFIIV